MEVPPWVGQDGRTAMGWGGQKCRLLPPSLWEPGVAVQEGTTAAAAAQQQERAGAGSSLRRGERER